MLVAMTGANGFIRQHVLAGLKERGVDVVAVIRKQYGFLRIKENQVCWPYWSQEPA